MSKMSKVTENNCSPKRRPTIASHRPYLRYSSSAAVISATCCSHSVDGKTGTVLSLLEINGVARVTCGFERRHLREQAHRVGFGRPRDGVIDPTPVHRVEVGQLTCQVVHHRERTYHPLEARRAAMAAPPRRLAPDPPGED